MATNYRVDQYFRNNTGNLIGFFQTKSEAMLQVSGMERTSVDYADHTEHLEITSFTSETCDMDGWEFGEIIETLYYI